MMRSVLQDWVMELPLRHQGVLASAIRGCDEATKPGGIERHLTAYLRGTFLNPADHREVYVPGAFIRLDPPEPMSWKASELGHFPQHYYAHLMHAFQVVAYCHPCKDTRDQALFVYIRMVNNMHLMPESFEIMENRLTEDRFIAGTVVS